MKSLFDRNRIWREKPVNESLVERARKKLSCSSVYARVVSHRYSSDVERLELRSVSSGEQLENAFHPPEDLNDLNSAVGRIVEALENKEKVFVHGDFDVDGLSSSALVYRGLKDIPELPGPGTLKVDVGSRNFGHGISRNVSSRLLEEDFDLLITTDCGVRGAEEISHLQDFGVDVIVTDHHEPADELPPALAVIDPKREDSNYPNPYLAGAGVAYKLVRGLQRELGLKRPGNRELLQLAALGTVADLVPLVVKGEDENRWLVKAGLDGTSKHPILGISALLGETGGEKEKITPETVSYRIAPKLNSANRVGDPQVSFLLLATESERRACHLAKTLIDYDRDRSRSQDELMRRAREKLDERGFDPEEKSLVFVSGEDWNQGIIGLVASRLSSSFGLPAVAVSLEKNRIRGSARGVDGVNVVEGLEECSEYLIRFGGHEMAGGFSASSASTGEIRGCLEEWARNQTLQGGEKAEKKLLDARLDPVQVSRNLYDELERLEPFGKGNPKPKFWMEGLKVVSARRVGNSKSHLKMKLAGNDEVLDGIGFGMGENLPALQDEKNVNPVFTLDLNDWRGQKKIQLKLKDFLS